MKTCPTCHVTYPSNYIVCPADGNSLEEAGNWVEGSIIRGKYRIVSKVGQGGMGSVYKATHLAFDELRALKAIAPELLSDQLFVKRFKHEAVITRRLQHPNAVRVDDIDEAEDGRPFIVMEFIEGKSLKRIIREEGPLAVPRVLAIVKQAASALDAAHRLGMIHRDIKPDNIQLVDTPDGEIVKVLDFGIAKVKEARMGEGTNLTLTGAGLVIGTPQYMSPEQAMGRRGDDLDGRADLYSLGVVMYQMLTADLPFKADTTMEMLLAHMQRPPQPIASAHPELHVPESVAALCLRLLEKNRDMRPATARVLIHEIEKLEKDLASPQATRPVPADDQLMRTMQGQGLTSGEPVTAPTIPPLPQPPVVPPTGVSRTAPPPAVRQQPQFAGPQTPRQPAPSESRWGIWAALIVLLVGVGGGGLWIATRQGTLEAMLTADPTTVEKGQSVTLHWTSQNATDLDLEPGIGKVQPQGSQSVTPENSTTYTLTAAGASGTQTSEVHIDVTSPPPPLISQPAPERPSERTSELPSRRIAERVSQHASGHIPQRISERAIEPAPQPSTVREVTPPVQPPAAPPVPLVDQKAVKGKINLGDFHYRRGEYDEAIEAYQEGLKLDPANGELQKKLKEVISACKKENAILNEGLKCGSN